MLLAILLSFLKHQQTTYILTLLLLPGYGNHFLAESWTATSSPKKSQAYPHASVCPLWSFAFRSLHTSLVFGVESSFCPLFHLRFWSKTVRASAADSGTQASRLRKVLYPPLILSHGSPIAKLLLSLLSCFYSFLLGFDFYLYTRLNIMNLKNGKVWFLYSKGLQSGRKKQNKK